MTVVNGEVTDDSLTSGLYNLGPLKLYVANGTTDTNGEVTFNLTKDGTSTGQAIFNTVLFNVAAAIGSPAAAIDVAKGSMKSIAGNLKTTTHKFAKGTSLGVLGPTLVNAPSLPVQLLVIGT